MTWRDVTRFGMTFVAGISSSSVLVATILFLLNRHQHPLNKMNAGVTTSFALSVLCDSILWALPFGVTAGDFPCGLYMMGVSYSMAVSTSGVIFIVSILVGRLARALSLSLQLLCAHRSLGARLVSRSEKMCCYCRKTHMLFKAGFCVIASGSQRSVHSHCSALACLSYTWHTPPLPY